MAVIDLQGLFQHFDGLGGAGHDGVGAQLHGLEQVGVLLGEDHGHHVAQGAHPLHGLGADQHAGFAGGTQHQHVVVDLDQLGGLGGSAGHIQGGQRKLFAQIVGQPGVQAAFEQDGLAHDVHPVDVLVHGQDLVDAQGGQGQGDQRGDLVAGLQVDLVLQIVADGVHDADEHAAGAGDRVLLLATLGHDGHNHLTDLLLIAPTGLGDLGEGGGVDVQGGDVHQDFVGVDLSHIVVDPVSGLSQDSLGFDDAMGTVLVAFLLHGKHTPICSQ